VPKLPAHLAKAPIGRERLSRQALSEHQRERILAAATGVFAKRGYSATTIDNIVAAAKGSVGSFYGLFDGKEDCFLAVYDRILQAAQERITTASPSGGSWAERAYLGLHEVLVVFAAAPLEARIALIEVQTAGPLATARYNAVMDATIEWLRGGRREHPDAAELPASFEQAAVAGFAFFLAQRLLASEPLTVEGLFDDAAQMVLEPVIGAGELRRLSATLSPA
jgi:AcrR family transcriptional regulator